MTVPCTSCGNPLAADDLRCARCGTLAPPRWGASVFAEAPEEPPAETPWSIPIRDRDDEEPARPQEVDPFRAVAYAVVIMVALSGLVVLASQVIGSGGGGDDDLAGSPAARDDVEVLGESVTVPTTSTSTSTSTSTTTTTTTSTTSTTSPAPSSGDVPTLPSSFRGGWVAQLSSVPVSAGSARLEAAWDKVRPDAPDTVAARSDEWPSLSPGYWVLVEPGPFGSEGDVREFCASIDRSSDACLPRMLTDRR